MDNREIDQQIATVMGWSNFSTRSDWYEDPDVGPYEQERLMAYDNEGRERTVPNWQHSTDAALELVGDHYFALNQNPQTEMPDILWEAQIGLRGKWGRGSTPAIAICKSWLEFTASKMADQQNKDRQGYFD